MSCMRYLTGIRFLSILLLDPQGRIVAKELRGENIYKVAVESMNK